MKKRLLSVFVAFVMTLSTLAVLPVGAAVQDYRNPFEYFGFNTYDGFSGSTAPRHWLSDGLYEQKAGFWTVYKNLNFTSIPKSVIVAGYSQTADWKQAGNVELRLDSPTGKLVASINPKGSPSWGVSADNVVTLSDEITGVHDLYAVWVGAHSFRMAGIKFEPTSEKMLRFKGEKKTVSYVDISDEDANIVASKLVSLGLMKPKSEDVFGSRDFYTLDEAMHTASVMYGIDFETQLKSDNGSETKYFEYFNYKKDKDFGRYVGTDPISCEDFAGLMIGILGWADVMETRGISVLSMATELKLFNGLSSVKPQNFLAKSDVAVILDNAINAKVLQIESVGTDKSITYDIMDEEGILSVYSNVFTSTGIVSDNYFTSSFSDTFATNEVKINGVTYKTGSTDVAWALGYEVEFYFEYNEKSRTRTILYARKTDGQETFVSSEDIISIGMSAVTYQSGTSAKKVSISPALPIIYNGVYADGYTTLSELVGDLEIFRGSMTFIDNNADRKIDIIKIESVKSLVVKGFAENEGIIFDHSGARYDLKQGRSDYEYTAYSENGDFYDLTVIESGTVVDIATTHSNVYVPYTRITVCDRSVYGTVEEVCKDDRTITIDGWEYNLSPQLAKSDMISMGKEIEAGTEGTFLLDSFGNVFAFMKESRTVAGIIVAYDIQKSAFDKNAIIKIYTYEGKMKTAVITDKAVIDGLNLDTAQKVLDHLETNSLKGTVAVYKMNGNDEIYMMDTIATGTSKIGDKLTRLLTNSRNQTYNNVFFGSAQNKYAYTGNLMFSAPYSGSKSDADENYKIISSLGGDWGYYDIYSTDGSKYFGDIVVKYGDAAADTQYYVVERLKKVMLPDGDITVAVDCYPLDSAPTKTTLEFDRISGYNDYFSDTINLGDVIRVSKDVNGRIINAGSGSTVSSGITKSTVFATANFDKINGTVNSTGSSQPAVWFGEVVDIKDNLMVIESDGGVPLIVNISNAKYIAFDTDRKAVREASVGDIIIRDGDTVGTGTKVMLKVTACSAGTVLFYEN